MMTKNSLFAVALLSLALCAGCATGGGGHTKGVQVTVADASVPNVGVNLTVQFTATVTGTDNHGVTWSVSGDGCTGSACGTVNANGLYTAPGTAPNPAAVKITATSQADTSRFGSLSINVLQIAVNVTPKLNNNLLDVAEGVKQQFTARAVPDDKRAQLFDWTVTCAVGDCGSIDFDPNNSSQAVYTAPAAPPSGCTDNNCVHVTATSKIDQTGPDRSNTVDVTVVPSRLAGNSTYAFHVSGFAGSNQPIAVAGNFQTNIDGTLIIGGTEDELTASNQNTRTITSGSFFADTNIHGTLTLTTSAGPRTYKVVFNAAGDGQMIEYDTPDSGRRASGEIAQATKSKFNNNVLSNCKDANSNAIPCSFVFGLSGVDTVLRRAGLVGLLKSSVAGTISSGMLDINEGGTPTSSADVTGTYDIQSNGRGSMSLTNNTSGKTYNYAVYMVGGATNNAKNPLTLFVISTDDPQNNPAVSGKIVFRDPTQTYDNSGLNSFSVSSLTGLDSTGTHSMVSLTNGRGDGSGKFNGSFDANNAGGKVSAQTFTCPYSPTLDQSNHPTGRYTLSLLANGTSCTSGVPFVLYASANSRGFLLDQSSSAVFTGQMDQQPITNLGPSELAGSFAAATVNPGTSGVSHAAMNLLMTSLVPDDFTLVGKQDETNGGQNAGQALVGTYTVSFDGTGSMKITPSGQSEQNYVIYVLDNPKSSSSMIQHFVMINVDSSTANPSIIFAER